MPVESAGRSRKHTHTHTHARNIVLLAKQTQAHLVLITGISPNSGAKNTLESTRQAPRAMTAYPAYPIVGFVSFTWVISSKTPDHLVT